MTTTLYLVRHGETMGNRVRRYQPYDTPLTDEGRAQARLVAARLAEEGPFAALYASDLTRTLETAAAIGEQLGLRLVPDPRLRELDCGDWKGVLYTEIEARFPGHRERWIAAGGLERLPGPEGESTTDVHARVTAAFNEYVTRHAGGRVILVSHGWALGMLLAAIEDVHYADAFREQRYQFGNTSVTIVEVDNGGVRRCSLRNCTRHLVVAAGNEGSP
ncbi:MAG TPA: histidine phosphatase family protein [Dehalococcoidia bacterium]|jgi:broad specificity phosphatase PhoE|nr:histidine phosphatase family protein [Dehalococcoidia bacterium]